MLRGTGDNAHRQVTPASDYRLTSCTTSFHFHASGPGLVVLMEAYQTPYNVRFYLDGRLVSPLRLDEAFLGAFVPAAGEHEVRVVYGPRDLWVLLGVSALGLLLLAGTALGVCRFHRHVALAGRGARPLLPPLPNDDAPVVERVPAPVGPLAALAPTE